MAKQKYKLANPVPNYIAIIDGERVNFGTAGKIKGQPNPTRENPDPKPVEIRAATQKDWEKYVNDKKYGDVSKSVILDNGEAIELDDTADDNTNPDNENG